MKVLAGLCAVLSVCICLPAFAEQIASFNAASIEFNPVFKQREQNFPAMEAAVKQAAENQAKLILFPEMSTTGYLYGSRAEIAPYVDTIPGKTTAFFEEVAKKYEVHIVVGMPEVDSATGMYYNAAFLVGPDGLIGKYRKNNLFLLESGWAAQGNLGVPVFDTPLGKISIVICYDDYFYQSTRLASLKGANLLAFIASSGRMLSPDPKTAGVHISISDVQRQALQNGLFVVAANRNNIEKNDTLSIGVHYLGGASIWDPLGKNIAQAPVSTEKGQTPAGPEPTILYGEIDPSLYDNSAKELLKNRRP
jgi:predicted amidohydrolase